MKVGRRKGKGDGEYRLLEMRWLLFCNYALSRSANF